MNIGSCCGGDFQADIAFRFATPSQYDVATVRAGFCHNQTLAEYSTSDKFEAIRLPAIPPQETYLGNSDAPLSLDYLNRGFKTHVYPAGTKALRFRLGGSRYSKDLPLVIGNNFPGFVVNTHPSLFARLLEMPFPSPTVSQEMLDHREWKRLDLQKQGGESGFLKYGLKNSADKLLIIPDSNCLGFFAGNYLFKPRTGWNNVWFPLQGFGINVGLVFKTEPKDSPVYSPVGVSAGWFQGSGAPGSLDHFRGEPLTIYSNSFIAATDVLINNPPNDGDTVAMDSDVRTWRNIVTDPAHEIECQTYVSGNPISIAGAVAFAIQSFKAKFMDQSSPMFAPFVVANPKLYAVKQGPLGFRFVNPDGLLPWTIKATGNWAKVSQDSMGTEIIWRPNAQPFINQCRVIDTIQRFELFQIPLTGPFDKTVQIPKMNNPFIVQLFWGTSPNYVDQNHGEYKFRINIDPT